MFPQHLRDLLDVIMALRGDQLSDLTRFQLFTHNRAYRKLACRVLDFRVRWGGLPFDILSQHLDRNLSPKIIPLNYNNSDFHLFLQDYVTPESVMSSTSDTPLHHVYQVDADNAPQWLKALTDLWVGLEKLLLVEAKEKRHVKEKSPDPNTVNTIVTRLFILQSFMPVLVHLLSHERAAQALGDAGEFEGSMTWMIDLMSSP